MTELSHIFTRRNEQINPQDISGKVSYVGLENIESNTGNLVGEIITGAKSIKSIKNVFKKGDVLYGKLRPNLNKVWLADIDGICSTDIIVLTPNPEYSPKVYELVLRSDEFNQEVLKGLKGAQLPRVSFDYMSKLSVPVITKDMENHLLPQIYVEDDAMFNNKKLIELMEEKISAVLERV